ncbi:MAG: phosphoribosyltransferase [Planctomycetes bacterium]|nr:phosphoribosyltransferase [Planctomycetota bacterium]
MFRDRIDAAHMLAALLKKRKLHDPLVLAIPRGGVVTGAVLADELGAELDIVLSRKLRAPDQPEFAIGAISEDGHVFLNPHVATPYEVTKELLEQERRYQLAEITRRKKLFRSARPQASIEGRSVIVTDDGIATGSTMMAALQIINTQKPRDVVVAAPVAPPDRLAELRPWCDDIVCLHTPEVFWAIGEFYDDFRQVEDDEVIALLRPFAKPTARRATPATRSERKA